MPSIDLVKDSFQLHLTTMKICGLYPYDSWPEIYKLYSFFFYLFITLPTATLAMTHFITEDTNPYEYVIAQNGYVVVQLLTRIFKLLPYKTNPEGIRRTIFALNQPVFNKQLREQDYILLDIVKACRYTGRVLFVTSALCVVAWACIPLMSDERGFPFDVWVPFDPFQSKGVYWSVYLYLVLASGSGGLDNGILDSLVAGLIYHAAGQLRVLKDTLMHLNRRSERQILEMDGSTDIDNEEALKSKIIYGKICECVDHYDAISQFVNDLERTFSFTVFSQFAGSIVVLCICILQLSIAEPTSITFLSAIAFTILFLAEIFIYCYCGTILYEESNTVINAIYMSEWYTYDRKSKKALIILMERAKRPMKVTVGNMLELSLETFTMILRRSYSLLAFLKSY